MIYNDICVQSGGEVLFGYIKPYVPALRVAEHEAYRGAYCGLCRTMGAMTGQVSRFTLSYDLTFLAIFRMAIERIPSEFEMRRCIVHPVVPRCHMKRNGALEYAAAASAVLTGGKLSDTVRDERGMKRALAKAASPAVRSMVKRVRDTVGLLEEEVRGDLAVLSKIEEEKNASLDAPANAFGVLLGRVMSFGLEGDCAAVAGEIGRALGKIIYILDAADDLADDIKGEKYNPIALIYNDPVDATAKRPLPRRGIADDLYTAIGLEANRAAADFELIDESGIATYKAIVMNVLTLGIRAEAERVLYGKGKRHDPRRVGAILATDQKENNQIKE